MIYKNVPKLDATDPKQFSDQVALVLEWAWCNLPQVHKSYGIQHSLNLSDEERLRLTVAMLTISYTEAMNGWCESTALNSQPSLFFPTPPKKASFWKRLWYGLRTGFWID